MKQLSGILFLLAACLAASSQLRYEYLFVGTYTDNKPGKGIYIYRADTATGQLTLVSTGAEINNPSFLTLSRDGRFVYACTETKTLLPGNISAFAFDSVAGTIRFINKQSSTGANPVYVTADPTGAFALTVNYTGGSVAVLPINGDGSLSAPVQSITFRDSSLNKARQEKPHLHSVYFSPDGGYVYTPDLGSDKIRAFNYGGKNGLQLAINDRFTVHTEPGSGPRHMVFHPSKKWAYCIEEMSGMVAVYTYKNGRLRLIQHSASYQQQADEHSGADIHLSPDGLFLYASNRVENTISIFSVANDGKIRLAGHQPTMGDVPRNFIIDPSGHFLLVANQGSNNIVVFKRDRATGLLQETGYQAGVPSPSCLQMRVYYTK